MKSDESNPIQTLLKKLQTDEKSSRKREKYRVNQRVKVWKQGKRKEELPRLIPDAATFQLLVLRLQDAITDACHHPLRMRRALFLAKRVGNSFGIFGTVVTSLRMDFSSLLESG
ncbi:hypothetical protein CEXT_329371 [Caerostris extrusa]|uniref:Uncharacterized protein n=1 Tax=Caerostris extrusa TaxID=172846 RepID=A0AAV4R8V9_CAEEX|nr:hypothetical protein CEXT_329371 [Caerostris extrusa]